MSTNPYSPRRNADTGPRHTPSPDDPGLALVPTARNATLADLVTVLRDQHAAKLDVVTSARDLRADGGRLHVGDAGHDITPDGVTRTDAILAPTHAADASIARKLEIPTPYLRRLRDQHTALCEPPRRVRRLDLLRRWSHDTSFPAALPAGVA